jgi:hypothetical protein
MCEALGSIPKKKMTTKVSRHISIRQAIREDFLEGAILSRSLQGEREIQVRAMQADEQYRSLQQKCQDFCIRSKLCAITEDF